jgi:hypothetical protein
MVWCTQCCGSNLGPQAVCEAFAQAFASQSRGFGPQHARAGTPSQGVASRRGLVCNCAIEGMCHRQRVLG